MLYFVGKDLLRWIGQCMDLVARTEELGSLNIREQSFAALLIYHAPPGVLEKLRQGGVPNPQSVFSRAIGLPTLFREVPPIQNLSEASLIHYHSFAHHLFVCAHPLAS